MRIVALRIALLVVMFGGLTSQVWAQDGDNWEIYGVGGGSLYRDLSATANNPSRSAKAGFFQGVAAGMVVAQTGQNRWGGEFHYLFQTNNMRLRPPSGSTGGADFSGQSHILNYDVLLYAAPRQAKTRLYIAGGPGFKYYQASGLERAFQPLSSVVILSRENDVKFLVSGGAGVKHRINNNTVIRADFRDYVTGIPNNFAAFPGAKLGGQFHNFVATFGVGILF